MYYVSKLIKSKYVPDFVLHIVRPEKRMIGFCTLFDSLFYSYRASPVINTQCNIVWHIVILKYMYMYMRESESLNCQAC